MLLKDIENYASKNLNKSEQDADIMDDVRYISKSCSLITESLQKGCDVMQMPNGDIIITEMKAITFHYTWDAKKGALQRNQPGVKSRRAKSKQVANTYEEESARVEELA